MFNEFYRSDQILVLKLYIITFILALVCYYPLSAYRRISAQKNELQIFQKKFRNNLENEFIQDQSEIAFEEILGIMSSQKFIGEWTSSIKQSKVLKAQNGTFQLQIKPQAETASEYIINMKITDGHYSDNGKHILSFQSDALRTKQQFVNNFLMYETTTPIIATSKYEQIFSQEKEKPIYLNKLKFRISFSEKHNLKLELLIAAEYDINIIINQLDTQKWVISYIFFTIVFIIQLVTQAFGTYFLYQQNSRRKGMISPKVPRIMLGLDLTKLITISYLYFTNEHFKTFVLLPLLILVFIILQMQFPLLSSTSLKNQETSPSKFINRGQDLIICLGSFLFFYICNLSWVYFIMISCVVMTPQIIHNFFLGGKVHYSWKAFLLYTCSNLIHLSYCRFYQGNIFKLEPSYTLCAFSLFIISLQIIMIAIQKKYGSKSIVPQFLVPKTLTQFKIFMIQTHDQSVCSICLGDLQSLPPEKQIQSEEIEMNKIVITPCKHQFHYACLLQWQQSKLQCPNCRRNLPPVDQQQLYYH